MHRDARCRQCVGSTALRRTCVSFTVESPMFVRVCECVLKALWCQYKYVNVCWKHWCQYKYVDVCWRHCDVSTSVWICAEGIVMSVQVCECVLKALWCQYRCVNVCCRHCDVSTSVWMCAEGTVMSAKVCGFYLIFRKLCWVLLLLHIFVLFILTQSLHLLIFALFNSSLIRNVSKFIHTYPALFVSLGCIHLHHFYIY